MSLKRTGKAIERTAGDDAEPRDADFWMGFMVELLGFTEEETSLQNALNKILNFHGDAPELDDVHAVRLRAILLRWIYSSVRLSLEATYLCRALRGEARLEPATKALGKKRIANSVLQDLGRIAVEASRERDPEKGIFAALPKRVY